VDLAVKKQEGVDAVERALSILGCFDAKADALTLTQLAQGAGLYKSTVLRLCASLIRKGFLDRLDDGQYVLGPELRRLGSVARSSFNLDEIFRPILRELAETTGETAAFFIRSGAERVCLFRENSAHALRLHLTEGGRMPLAPGAPAIIFQAYDEGLDSEKAAAVKRRRLAMSKGERDPGLAGIAVPILNGERRLLGVLNVSTIITRFNVKHQAMTQRVLLDCAQRVEAKVCDVGASDIAEFVRHRFGD
jgi:DNA-binding IclR family transcriptional regulator